MSYASIQAGASPIDRVQRGAKPLWQKLAQGNIELVAQSSVTNGSSATSYTVANPSTTPGEFLLALLVTEHNSNAGNAEHFVPAGWTSIAQWWSGLTISHSRCSLLWREASAATETTFTWGTDSRNGASISAWSGVNLVDPVGAVETNSQSGLYGGNTYSLPAATVPSPNSVQLRYDIGANAGSVSLPDISGLTQLNGLTWRFSFQQAYGPAEPPSVGAISRTSQQLANFNMGTLVLNPS